MLSGMKALVLLAEGFEEIEAVTIIDVLRRGGVTVTTAALGKSPVRGSHGIAVEADTALDGLAVEPFDAVILPGGMPGAKHLREDERVQSLLKAARARGKILGAICAGPIALESAGLLKDKRATSYPGHGLPSARYVEEPVVVDGDLITSRGPGTALDFALVLVARLAGGETAERLRHAMLVRA
jgi:protein deglycase